MHCAALAILLVGRVACSDGGPTYYADIKPILEKHCTACHNSADKANVESSGGLSLDKPEDLLGATAGQLVVVGRANRSDLYRRLVHADAEKRMPKDDVPLPDDATRTIRRWIEEGAELGTPDALAPKIAKPAARATIQVVTLTLDGTSAKPSSNELPAGRLTVAARVGPLAPVTALAHSPDGRWLAVGSRGTIAIWNLTQARLEAAVATALPDVLALGFMPDSKSLWLAGGQPGVSGGMERIDLSAMKPGIAWRGASDVVSGLAIEPNGSRVAAVGYDRMLRTFDARTGKQQLETKAHGDFVHCVAFSADGKWLVTGGKDATVKLWDAATLKSARAFSGHAKEVLAVCFSPSGDRIFSTGSEPEIRVWDSKRVGRPQLQNGHAIATHQFAWAGDRKRFATAGADRIVRIWSADAKLIRSCRAASDVLYAVSMAPDGRSVAGGGWDGVTRIWNVASGKLTASLLASDVGEPPAPGWLAIAESAAFTASPSWDDRVELRAGKTTKPLRLLRATLERPSAVHAAIIGNADK